MRKLLFLILSFVALHVSAQQPSLYFRNINSTSGLSNNKINCILQDRRGFIWIGTDDGLNRYDGRYFAIFNNDPSNPSSLSGNIIKSIIEDSDGIIWVATADGGLTRYDHRMPADKQFIQYKHIPGDSSSIPVNIINDIEIDRRGFIWLATGGSSVIRFDKRTGKFLRPVTKGTSTALTLAIDREDIIWVGREGGGILKINTNDLSSSSDERYKDLYADLPHAAVTALYEDRKNNMWLGSWDAILYRYNRNTRSEESFRNDQANDFVHDEVLSFAEDRDGRLWIGGKSKGLQLFQDGKFFNFRKDPTREGTLADNTINCIYTDRKGLVWIGTNKGISLYEPSQKHFQQSFLPIGESTTIYDFLREDGKLLIGTSNGLFIKEADGNIIHHQLRYRGEKLAITCFYRDETDNTLYLGTDYTLFVYDEAGKKVVPLPNTEKDEVMNRIIKSRIVSIVRDTIDGHPALIVSPYGHFIAYYDLADKKWISRLDPEKKLLASNNLRDNLVRKIFKAADGSIWLANGKLGLGKWKESDYAPVVYHTNNPSAKNHISNNNVFDIREDARGKFWISTYGGGLNMFDRTTGKFEHIAESSHLVEGIEIDSKGNLWMISNGNLYRYDTKRKSFTAFSLPDVEKSGGIKGFIRKDENGLMYVAGDRYFISFDPMIIREEVSTPGVYFTDFRIFNSSHPELLQEKSITLKHNQNYFTIEFAAPEFMNAIEYSYMLEGFDPEWIDGGSLNKVSYSNLEAGNYIFKIRATTRKGSWMDDVTMLNISIHPPFWRTWWFYAFAVIFLTGIVYAMYRYRINELLKRQEIRNKIAQDLHDNMGSTLSSISVYSQVAKIYKEKNRQDDLQSTLEKISTISGEMISEMNDIVWAINPRNDNMEKIVQRMESFAKPLLSSKDIQLHFSYDPSVPYLNLGMTKRKNFYLIFKEAVNNALKYSGARNLWVNISHQHQQIELSIRDDGKGFDTVRSDTSSLSGNGLQNMKMRAAEMKGSVYLASNVGQGTVITLKFFIP